MKVLALSGGAFRGAFQVPIVDALAKDIKYDCIVGVSVGSINGVLAAQENLKLMWKFWRSIDDPDPLNGIKGFLKPALQKFRGVYSLDPLYRLVRRHVAPDKLKIPFGAGVVIRETGEYRNFYFNGDEPKATLHTAIMGSSAIAGLMEPYPAIVGDKRVLLSDGGHKHVLPLVPDRVTELDAVFVIPLKAEERQTEDVDSLIQAFMWAAEMQMHAQALADFERLKMLAKQGVKVRVFFPQEPLGGMLAASALDIEKRIRAGQAALRDPLIL